GVDEENGTERQRQPPSDRPGDDEIVSEEGVERHAGQEAYGGGQEEPAEGDGAQPGGEAQDVQGGQREKARDQEDLKPLFPADLVDELLVFRLHPPPERASAQGAPEAEHDHRAQEAAEPREGNPAPNPVDQSVGRQHRPRGKGRDHGLEDQQGEAGQRRPRPVGSQDAGDGVDVARCQVREDSGGPGDPPSHRQRGQEGCKPGGQAAADQLGPPPSARPRRTTYTYTSSSSSWYVGCQPRTGLR